jgi:predicted PurR-regulated permease PerM
MAEQDGEGTVRVDVDARTIFRLVVAVALVWLLVALWPVLVVLLVALILVGTLAPVVMRLERRGVPRSMALVIVFVSLSALVALVCAATIPALVTEVEHLIARAPELGTRIALWLSARGFSGPAEMIERAGKGGEGSGLATFLFAWSQRAFVVIGLAVTTVFLAFYLLADRERVAAAVYALVPRRRHARVRRIFVELEAIVGGYVRGQLITSGLIFAFVFAMLSALRVPDALALAVFAGATDVLPFIGGLLATTPAAIAAAVVHGVPGGIVVAAAMVVYQELESRVLIPRVYGRALRLPAWAVILALLAGGELGGILGALLSLPIAAGLRLLVHELRAHGALPMPGQPPPAP